MSVRTARRSTVVAWPAFAFLLATLFTLFPDPALASGTAPGTLSAAVAEDGTRWAARVIGFSSEYSNQGWGASQTLGEPDTYPRYGDISSAWASSGGDDQREWLVLGYDNPAPVRAVAVYETYKPGAVDTIYVRNAITQAWNIVWSGTAAPAGDSARVLYAEFPETGYPVDAVRIAVNSPEVNNWNEIDAVALISGTGTVPGRDFALQFDGQDDQLHLPAPLDQTEYTIEAWVRPGRTTDQSVLVRTNTSGPTSQYSHQILIRDGRFEHYTYDGGRRSVVGTTPVVAGQWYHVAITAKNNDRMHLYVNGREEGTSLAIASLWTGGDRYYMGPAGGVVGAFQGTVDEVRLWSTARAQSDIHTDMRERLAGTETGLVGYWRLDEGTGTLAVDASGTGNDGTLENGPVWTPSTASEWEQFPLTLSGIGAFAPASLELTWSTLPEAARYRIEVATSPDVASVVDRTDVGNVSAHVYGTSHLQEGGTYFARVVALDGQSETPFASSAFSGAFIVDRTAPIVRRPVGQVEGNSEVSFAVQATDNLRLERLTLQVATEPTFGDLLYNASVHSGEPVSVSAAPGQSLYARAFAEDGAGNESGWSETSLPVQAAPLPDLTLAVISSPPTAFSGQEVEVAWTVRNEGEGATTAPYWLDYLYLSPTATLDETTARRVADVENVTALLPNEEYAARAVIRLPEGIQGPFYFIVSVAGSGSQRDADVQNNVLAASVTNIQLAAYPDLQVASATVPAEVFSGDFIDIKWTVENKGQGVTEEGVWYDAVFLSPDSVLDFTLVGQGSIRFEDQHLYSHPHGGILAHGDTATSSVQIRLPERAYGDQYLFIYADQQGEGGHERGFIYEFASEMNNWLRVPIKITLTPPADLEITGITAPAEAQSGKPLEISWEVQNNGFRETQSRYWRETVYLSATPELNPDSAYVVGTQWRTETLARFGTYTQTLSAPVPDGITGSYYLFVRTDVQDHEFEHDGENNNVRRVEAPLTVSLSPWPNLTVDSIFATQPLVAGSRVPVSWTIRNTGEAAAEASFWTDRVYLVPGVAWDSAAVLVAEAGRMEPLAPGATYSEQKDIAIPANASGEYSVFVFTDAGRDVYEHTAEGDNRVAGAVNIAAYPRIDLAVRTVAAPAETVSGATLAVSYQVTNVGEGATLAEEWFDTVYLSADTLLSPATDILLARERRAVRLGSGEHYAREVAAQVPNGMAGSFYLLVRTDADRHAQDADSTNNVRVLASPVQITLGDPVDLRVSALEVPAGAVAGQPLQVVWTVANEGAGRTARASWYDEIFLSRDGYVDPSDVLLTAERRDGALDSGASYTDTTRVTLPIHLSGALKFIVRADGRNEVYEHQAEANNVAAANAEVTIPAPSDLVVTGVSSHAQQVRPGQGVVLWWNVENRGEHPATGTISEAAYVSKDATWSIDDPLVGITEHSIDLAPGVAVPGKMEVNLARTFRVNDFGQVIETLPGVEPGDYFILVRTDLRNNIRETDETNNVTASEQPITAEVPVLTLGVADSLHLNTGYEQYFAFEAEAGQDYLVTLECSAGFSELFARHGAVPDRSSFDFTAGELRATNQQITIPSAVAGRYYLMAGRIDEMPLTPQCALTAKALNFEIREVRNTVAGNSGEVSVMLTGAKFAEGATAFLRRSGQTIEANLVNHLSSAHLFVRFTTVGLPTGLWDVVVRNPNGSEAAKENGLEVASGDPMRVHTTIAGPAAARVQQGATYVVNVHNPSNVNAERTVLWVEVQGDVEITHVGGLKPVPGDTITWSPLDIMVEDDGDQVVPLVAFNIPPGRTTSAQLTIRPRSAGKFRFLVGTHVLTRADFELAGDEAVREGIRQGWLDLPTPDSSDVSGAPAGKSGAAFAVASSCPYDDEWACRARRNNERVVDITEDLLDEDGPIRDAIDVVSANPTKPKGILKKFGGFFKSLLDFHDKWSESADYQPDAVESQDPNDILGPEGHGEERWVSVRQDLGYTIRFENDPKKATAPAQVVRITLPLDVNVDERSFRLGEFGFGSFRFEVPENRAAYTARLDVRDSLGVYVDVNAGIDVNTREAFWVFRSVDPATGVAPVNPLSGFLPVNDTLRHGEGYVRYTVTPKPSAKTRDLVRAQARIVFDINAPLDTPPIANTIDADVPVSRVLPLAVSNPATFPLLWSGSDVGAGVRDYAVFVSVNDGPFQLHKAGVADTTMTFAADLNKHYRFFSIATDRTGNVETMKSAADAATATAVEGEGGGAPEAFRVHQNHPNPFTATTALPFDLVRAARVEITIYNVLGQRITRVDRGLLPPGRHTERVNLGHVASGVYFYEIVARTDGGETLREVKKMMLVR